MSNALLGRRWLGTALRIDPRANEQLAILSRRPGWQACSTGLQAADHDAEKVLSSS